MNQNQTSNSQNFEATFNSSTTSFQKPVAIDKEVSWDKTQTLVSKIDLSGKMLYVNDTFLEVSGYDNLELLGKSHEILNHPEMPTVIYKMLWERINSKKRFYCIVLCLAKTGRYYWNIVDFEFVKDNSEIIIGYIIRQKAVSQNVINDHIQPLYRKLHLIEQASGFEASEQFLIGFLEDAGCNYEDYISTLIANDLKNENETEINWWHM